MFSRAQNFFTSYAGTFFIIMLNIYYTRACACPFLVCMYVTKVCVVYDIHYVTLNRAPIKNRAEDTLL